MDDDEDRIEPGRTPADQARFEREQERKRDAEARRAETMAKRRRVCHDPEEVRAEFVKNELADLARFHELRRERDRLNIESKPVMRGNDIGLETRGTERRRETVEERYERMDREREHARQRREANIRARDERGPRNASDNNEGLHVEDNVVEVIDLARDEEDMARKRRAKEHVVEVLLKRASELNEKKKQTQREGLEASRQGTRYSHAAMQARERGNNEEARALENEYETQVEIVRALAPVVRELGSAYEGAVAERLAIMRTPVFEINLGDLESRFPNLSRTRSHLGDVLCSNEVAEPAFEHVALLTSAEREKRRKKEARRNETADQRARRLQRQREYNRKKREREKAAREEKLGKEKQRKVDTQESGSFAITDVPMVTPPATTLDVPEGSRSAQHDQGEDEWPPTPDDWSEELSEEEEDDILPPVSEYVNAEGSEMPVIPRHETVTIPTDEELLQRARIVAELEKARRERRRRSQIEARRIFAFDTTQYNDFGNMDAVCPHCKAKHWIQERVKETTARRPQFGRCCSRGKIKLSPLGDMPQYLKELYTDGSVRARRFREKIRAYNSVLSMASVKAEWPNRGEGSSNFNPVISLHGKMYHFLGAAVPPEGASPKFLSAYIYDNTIAEQTEHRRQGFPDLDEEILNNIAEILHAVNPYVRNFRMLREWAMRPEDSSDEYMMVIHADKRPSGEHRGRYNGPEAPEIAAIIPGSEEDMIGNRDIVIKRRGVNNSENNEVLHSITMSHRSSDALCYVLLFPDGRDGWHYELCHSEDAEDGTMSRQTKITARMFYVWHFFEREQQFNPILYAAKLGQQYAIDGWIKCEQVRLSNIRRLNEDGTIRVANLSELIATTRAVADQSDTNARVGRPISIPDSFVGGERYMTEQMHDIIAISNERGHPDLFITITANPKWPEIVRECKPGQDPSTRVELIARVFRLKMQALINFIKHMRPFGDVVGDVAVVEFQKRGLPHAHCIFFLDRTAKQRLQSADHVDTIISAEIPPESDSELRDVVLKQNIHKPCGVHNRNSICMKEGKCSKQFPKPFVEATSRAESQYYVTYRRRSPGNGGETGTTMIPNGRNGRRQVQVDNSWVVPYSPVLSLMFQCHLNVELCISRVGGIKYLFKYITKGRDRITVKFVRGAHRVDEVEEYLTSRWVSASEAFWRLFSFPFVERSPVVVRLHVHEEGDQVVRVPEDGSEPDPAKQSSTLVGWFASNVRYPGARHILYNHFPKFFAWVPARKVWVPRTTMRVRPFRKGEPPVYNFNGVGEDVVGRVYSVSPRAGERFFLRLLLYHIAGARSFDDMRIVPGESTPQSTFRETCYKMGILESDEEWDHVLEQSFTSTFVPLTKTFVYVLCYCEPSNPGQLFDKRKNWFLDDFRNRHRRQAHLLRDNHIVLQYVLKEIQKYLGELGDNTLSEFGLPELEIDVPDIPSDPIGPRHITADDEDRSELEAHVNTSISKLNNEQCVVFNSIVGAILPGVSVGNLEGASSSNAPPNQPLSRTFFLDAPGGTGKSFVLETIHAFLRLRRRKVIAVASSGVAAQLLYQGRTAHSAFKIPKKCDHESTCFVSAQSNFARTLREVDLIIWDEIVMCQRNAIEAVERTYRDICHDTRTFGGKVVVFSGDFRQILPVIQNGSRAQVVHACVSSSPLMQKFTRLQLMQNMRLEALRNDPTATGEAMRFPGFLLRVGEGRESTDQENRLKLPQSITFLRSIGELCNRVFQGIEENFAEENWITNRAILCTINDSLVEVNDDISDRIPGVSEVYLSADKVVEKDGAIVNYPTEGLNQLPADSAMPDHRLTLKKGLVVMLLRNIDPRNGHANGSRYIVEDMRRNVINLRLATGAYKGNRLCLPRMPCTPSKDDYPIEGFRRMQFPIRVCFAMTTNKSQGQSFKGVLGLDLRTECFSHGQLYVALSRTTNPKNVFVVLHSPENKTKNVVYPEVLRALRR